MLASAIPAKFNIPFANSAGMGYIRAIPEASQIGITPGAASLTDGFPPTNFAIGGTPQSGQDVNGILNEATAAIRWLQAGGLAVYDAAFSTAIGGYPNGAVLKMASGKGYWQSTVDNNTSNPDAGGANWSPLDQDGIVTLTATVAANALTIGASAHNQTFRSATLGSGAVSMINAAPANIVIPSGATLGTTNGVLGRIMTLEMLVSGAAEIAVINWDGVATTGVTALEEYDLISTTAISAGATSATTIYSTTARANVPYRVLGFVESTQATAGTWATAPSRIQGAGAKSTEDTILLSSLGFRQTPQIVTRVAGTVYYNTTGKPIEVFFYVTAAATPCGASLLVNGVAADNFAFNIVGGVSVTLSAIVPVGQSYQLVVTSMTLTQSTITF